MVNRPLTRPYLLEGWHLGGLSPLDFFKVQASFSHDEDESSGAMTEHGRGGVKRAEEDAWRCDASWNILKQGEAWRHKTKIYLYCIYDDMK